MYYFTFINTSPFNRFLFIHEGSTAYHFPNNRMNPDIKIEDQHSENHLRSSSDNTPYEKIGNEVRSLADEVPFDIPDSWEWVTLQTIATSSLGKTLDKAKNKGDLKPYLCSINVYWDGIDLTTVKEVRLEESELPKYRLRPGDLLICEGGDVGRSAVWESTQEMYYQNALHRVKFYGGINPHFFQLLLECYKGNQILDAYSKGMTIKHLVQTALNTIIFPLPPLSEQTRIVDAVNRLLPYLRSYDIAEQKLTALNIGFPEALKKSILQEAVQGKLVPQDPSDEPAEALLERIRAEKQRLIKEGKIKKDKHESVIFRRDNSHYEKRGSAEVCIDDEIPFEIPENWTWARLSSASVSIADGDHQPPPQVQDGIPFLVISNVSGGRIDFSNTRYVPKEYFDSLAEIRIPQCGDLLFTVTGSYGIVIPVQTEREFCFQRHIALIKLSCLSPEFMQLWLSSPLVYEQCRKAATGTAQKTVGLAALKGLLIPIPPLTEQERIVQKLNTLLALAAL